MSDNMCEHGGLDGNCLRCKDATIARLEAEKAQKQLVIDDCKRNLQEQDAAIAALKAENERLKEDYERACKTVADMHAAAVGEIMGPKRGVVEDVADIRTELEQYRKVVGCLGRGWDYWFISDSDAKANNLDIAKLQKGMGK